MRFSAGLCRDFLATFLVNGLQRNATIQPKPSLFTFFFSMIQLEYMPKILAFELQVNFEIFFSLVKLPCSRKDKSFYFVLRRIWGGCWNFSALENHFTQKIVQCSSLVVDVIYCFRLEIRLTTFSFCREALQFWDLEWQLDSIIWLCFVFKNYRQAECIFLRVSLQARSKSEAKETKDCQE